MCGLFDSPLLTITFRLRSTILDIYCTKIEYDADISALYYLLPEKKAYLDLTKNSAKGIVYAYALLAFALYKNHGVSPPVTLGYTEYNKPYFTDREDIRFSISHTDTHCLCALSNQPLGVDIQTKRPVRSSLIRRVLAENEDPKHFFSYWVLKESYIKLIGRMDRPLCDMKFSITGDSAAFNNTHSYIFNEIPDCRAAVCAADYFEKPELRNVDLAHLLSFAADNNKNT